MQKTNVNKNITPNRLLSPSEFCNALSNPPKQASIKTINVDISI